MAAVPGTGTAPAGAEPPPTAPSRAGPAAEAAAEAGSSRTPPRWSSGAPRCSGRSPKTSKRKEKSVKNVHQCLPGHVCKLRDRAREMTMQAGELVASTRRGRHLGKRFYEMLSESFTVVLQLPCSQGKQGELTENCLQNL